VKTTDITIHKAVTADLPGIMEIEKTSFGIEAFSRRQMLYLMKQAKGIFLVARSGNRVVGYISFITNERYHHGRIYSVAVDRECRGCGISVLLIDEVIRFAREKGLHAIFLEVQTENYPAISLYTKKGFVKRSIKPGYYGDGADAFSMVLEIS